MKNILITNDDGILSGGIVRLAEAAKSCGEVWVVAPDHQRSAASHCITLHSEMELRPHDFPVKGVKAYATTGSPADCVRIACDYLMPKKPEVVLSGINHGYNVATDIQYSATAGAAFEAAFQGCLAIAFSERAVDCHEVADHYLEPLLRELIKKEPDPGHIYNVNFPGCLLSECRGILYDRAVSKERFYYDHYEETGILPEGGVTLRVRGDYHEAKDPGTDYGAVMENFVSVGIVNNVGITG